MHYWRIALTIAICLAAGAIGSFFTTPQIPTWYAGLIKPDFSPPNWLFGPVWTTLFILMGVAQYIFWQKKAHNRKAQLAWNIFWLQLLFNITWSLLFFGLQSPLAGLVDIVLLWLLILCLLFLSWRSAKAAFWLLLPYLLWVSFASVLNFAIWRLN